VVRKLHGPKTKKKPKHHPPVGANATTKGEKKKGEKRKGEEKLPKKWKMFDWKIPKVLGQGISQAKVDEKGQPDYQKKKTRG